MGKLSDITSSAVNANVSSKSKMDTPTRDSTGDPKTSPHFMLPTASSKKQSIPVPVKENKAASTSHATPSKAPSGSWMAAAAKRMGMTEGKSEFSIVKNSHEASKKVDPPKTGKSSTKTVGPLSLPRFIPDLVSRKPFPTLRFVTMWSKIPTLDLR